MLLTLFRAALYLSVTLPSAEGHPVLPAAPPVPRTSTANAVAQTPPAVVPAPVVPNEPTGPTGSTELAGAAAEVAGDVLAPALAADPMLDDELLAPAMAQSEELPDNSSDLSVDVDRWLLHDVLSEGVAQSPFWRASWQSQREAAVGASRNEADDWQNRLRLARASAMLTGLPQQHHAVDERSLRFDIPLASHPLVDLYIDYFTGRGRWFFERWLNRGSEVIPMMQDILAAEGVPKDLVYLAMVESGFSAHAYSSAAAVGYWQFIASTGSNYGLARDRFIDERRDFVRATQGAARFLAALHRHFGDWHLAWASYNAGESRIRRAMAKTGATTFWQLLARPNDLAKETQHYVPKIIAAAIVAKDAARYGFNIAPRPVLSFDTLNVRGALELAVLARESRCSLESLRALNPSLLYDLTPPNKTSVLRVPKGSQKAVLAALARLPAQKRVSFAAYRVRRGDTLSGVARKMQSNVETLRQFNRLSGNLLRPGTELVVPSFRLAAQPVPVRKKAVRMARAPARRSRATLVALASHTAGGQAKRGSSLPNRRRLGMKGRDRARAHHVVASGDTLWSIARRYNVPLEYVQGRARKANNRIAVGEVIDIF